MSETTFNVIVAGLMAVIGGLITTPINAFILRGLKRDEQFLQYKLDVLIKKRELLLTHSLEREIPIKPNDILDLKNQILELRLDIQRLERRIR